MKRSLTLILSLAMLMVFASCSGGAQKQESLYNRGLDLIQDVHALSRSEEYLNMMFGSPDMLLSIKEVSQGNYTEPYEVFVIKGVEDAMMTKLLTEGDLDETVKSIINKRLTSVLPAQLNALSGAMNLAAANILIAEKSFLSDETNESLIYLYKFDGGTSFTVSFIPDEEGIVNAMANVIFNDEIKSCESVGELDNFLASVLDISGIEIDMLKGR